MQAVSFVFLAALFFLFSAPASAQITGLTNRPLSEIIFSAIDWLLSIAAGLGILFIIIGGVYYVTAAGDESQMSSAKTIITYSIIGLFIVVISYSIMKTVGCIINPLDPAC